MKDSPRLPSWGLMLLVGVLAGNGLYAAYMHGFLAYDQASAYRADTNAAVVVPVIAAIPERSPDSIAAGEASYKQVCIACHGPNREGGVGPNLADAVWLHADQESELVALVERGVPAGQTKAGTVPMPPRGGSTFTKTQIWEIVYFLSSKNVSIKRATP